MSATSIVAVPPFVVCIPTSLTSGAVVLGAVRRTIADEPCGGQALPEPLESHPVNGTVLAA
jgi:hypothetical protein